MCSVCMLTDHGWTTLRDGAQPVRAGMLQIADRAQAEAQEAGEIVVCPRFPLQTAGVLRADRRAQLTTDASSRFVAERGGKRSEERHDALRAQRWPAVRGA